MNMTLLYTVWIGLIWFFGWIGWKLLRSGSILAVLFGLIMILIAIGLLVLLLIVAFLQG